MKTKNATILIGLLLLTAFGQLIAQPFNLDKNIQPQELKMVDYKKGDPLLSGKISIANIRQTSDTAYFFVKGAGIYQQVVITGTNRKPNQKLDIALCKERWDKSNRTGIIDDKTPFKEQFKTEGSFGIRVISKRPNPEYQLMVWIGDEPKKIKMENAFVNKTKIKKP